MANDITTRPGALSLIPTNMSEAIQLAEFMCKAKTLPEHLRNSPGDCLMVIEQAMRWGMSPFAVAQATSSIKGKLMYEGKLVAAAVENSGAIDGLLDHRFDGEGDERSITVWATRTGESKPREVTVELRNARTANEMWTRQPDQQLVYHGTRVWARRWTPAVILGVYSREEMIGDAFEGQTIEGKAEEPSAPSAPYAPSARHEAVNKEVPIEPTNGNGGAYTPQQWNVWFGRLDAELDKVQPGPNAARQWDELWARPGVARIANAMTGELAERLDAIRIRHAQRIFPEGQGVAA